MSRKHLRFFVYYRKPDDCTYLVVKGLHKRFRERVYFSLGGRVPKLFFLDTDKMEAKFKRHEITYWHRYLIAKAYPEFFKEEFQLWLQKAIKSGRYPKTLAKIAEDLQDSSPDKNLKNYIFNEATPVSSEPNVS